MTETLSHASLQTYLLKLKPHDIIISQLLYTYFPTQISKPQFAYLHLLDYKNINFMCTFLCQYHAILLLPNDVIFTSERHSTCINRHSELILTHNAYWTISIYISLLRYPNHKLACLTPIELHPATIIIMIPHFMWQYHPYHLY